jgi:hypothetical protein
MATGPDTSQGINIGDCVLHFLGNTQNLDEAFNRVANEAATKMGAAASSVGQVGDAVDGVAERMAVGQQGAVKLGEVVTLAGEKAKFSMYEARGEAGLLGEAFGIHLPRHVRSFVAELPGVGAALSAAFAATAVFFLIEALVKGSEKLSNWIANTFIFTQAMKDSDAAIAKANKTLLEHAAAIDKATHALDEYGMTAAQKTQTAIDANNNAWAQNTAKIALNREEMEKLKNEHKTMGASVNDMTGGVLNSILAFSAWTLRLDEEKYQVKDNTKAIGELDNAYIELMKTQQELAVELKILGLQLRDAEDAARKQSAAAQAAYDQAKIQAAQTVGSAVLAFQKATALALIGLDSSTAGTRLALDAHFAEKQYELQLSTAQKKIAATQQSENQIYQLEQANLENRLSVQKTMGDAGKEGAAATQVQIEELTKNHNLRLATEAKRSSAEIEALEKNHETKLLNDATKFKEEFNQIIKAAFAFGTDKSLGAGLGPMVQELDQVDAAAKKLGVTLESSLAKSTAEAKKAVDVLTLAYKHNLVSLDDLHRGELAHVQAELAEARATGQNTLALQREEAELKKLIPVIKSADKNHQGLQKIILKTDEAFNSFVFAMASGSESIGQAAKKMTEQMLQALAQWAAAKGAASLAQGFSDLGDPFTAPLATAAFEGAALWFALAGAAGAVGGAISGSGGGGGSSSHNPAGLSAGQTGSSGGGSNQTVSVTHLAEGGLVTGPTRAIIGEQGAEAVIPLTDSRFANALLSSSTLRMASPGLSDPAAIAASSNARQGGMDDAAIGKLGDLIGAHLDASGGAGDTHHHHWNVKGMISADNMAKVMDKMSKMVQQNRATLHASNSFRVTRRSQ